jgi:hypothetical protein
MSLLICRRMNNRRVNCSINLNLNIGYMDTEVTMPESGDNTSARDTVTPALRLARPSFRDSIG